MMERILEDFCHAYGLQGIALRYFNPIGADPKFRSGPYIENPTHLLGSLVEVAAGRKDLFELHGIHWPTRDGSAMRDYIHVWDLARAHVLAAEKFQEVFSCNGAGSANYCAINLGTGNGVICGQGICGSVRKGPWKIGEQD